MNVEKFQPRSNLSAVFSVMLSLPFVLASLSASAEESESSDLKTRIAVDSAIGPGGAAKGFSPILDIMVPVASHVLMEAAWGASFANLPSSSAGFSGSLNEAVALNPFLGVHAADKFALGGFRLGLGVALPVVGAASGYSALNAGIMYGLWNPWLFAANTMSVVAPARVDIDLFLVELALEGALTLGIPTASGHDLSFGFQVAAEAVIPIMVILEAGARIQMVTPNATVSSPISQTAFEPFVGLNLGPAHIRGGLLMNLDTPYGFAFDTNGAYAFKLSAALEF